MNFDDVRQMALIFPGSEEYIQFGQPALRFGKHFLACIAKIDKDTLVLKVLDPLAREIRLAANPEVYYLTNHYASFDALLIRLPHADREEVRQLIEHAWRYYAPKKLVAAYSKQ